jgi:hypothetical protein
MSGGGGGGGGGGGVGGIGGGAGGGAGGGGGHIASHVHAVGQTALSPAAATAAANKIGHVEHVGGHGCHKDKDISGAAWLLLMELEKKHHSVPPGVSALA